MPEDAGLVLIILIAVIIALLGLFTDIISSKLIASVNISILSATAGLLLVAYRTMVQLKESVEPPKLSKVFKKYNKLDDEIENSLKSAQEIFLLTRTTLGWWRDYGEELEALLRKKGENRLLLLDPKGEAYKMAQGTSKIDWTDNYIEHLQKLCEKEALELKVIDHLPACMLLIINPIKRNRESIIYVAISTYTNTHRGPTVFKIRPQDELFEWYLKEFNDMWKAAEPWTGHKTLIEETDDSQ